jgi:hypothetical protein
VVEAVGPTWKKMLLDPLGLILKHIRHEETRGPDLYRSRELDAVPARDQKNKNVL